MTRGGRRRAGLGGRKLNVRVKTAKGRKTSSTRWLQRQLNDDYVAAAKRHGYRSRAAYKLIELDDRFGLLKPGYRIVDLGAAPGGWTQVAVQRAGPGGTVIALDTTAMEPVAGARIITADFMDEATPALLKDALGGAADLVLSDMAPVLSGHTGTDHLRIVALVEAALEFATDVLAPGGTFVAKVFQGGTEQTLLAGMKLSFAKVRHAKPPASRAESSEIFVVAQGFRGAGAAGGTK